MLFEEYDGQGVHENPDGELLEDSDGQKGASTNPDISTENPKSPDTPPENLENSDISTENPKNQEKYNEAIEEIFGERNKYEMVFKYAGNGLTEEIDIGNGEKIQKKVIGFNKNFEGDDDGKSVNVRKLENGDIVFNFLNGVNQLTTITLSNMMKVANGNDQSDGSNEASSSLSSTIKNPIIRINGNTENLPNFLKNLQGESIVTGEIELGNSNVDKFMKIFDALHNNIIKPKIDEIHGYVQKVLDNDHIMESWLEPALQSVENSEKTPTQRETFIDGLMDTGAFNSTLEIKDIMELGIKRVLVSLCVLLISGCSAKEIKTMILEAGGYSDGGLIEQKNVTNLSNEAGIEVFSAVDGIPAVSGEYGENFVSYCIGNGDILVNLAIKKLVQDKNNNDFGKYGGESRLNKILTFLNKENEQKTTNE